MTPPPSPQDSAPWRLDASYVEWWLLKRQRTGRSCHLTAVQVRGLGYARGHVMQQRTPSASCSLVLWFEVGLILRRRCFCLWRTWIKRKSCCGVYPFIFCFYPTLFSHYVSCPSLFLFYSNVSVKIRLISRVLLWDFSPSLRLCLKNRSKNIFHH